MREHLRITYALGHLVAVLDMLMNVFNSRVEDVRQAMFAQVFHAEDAIGLSVSIVGI